MLYKSKLISILRTLSGKEFKRFESYINSPFFNKNEKVISLFNLLKKYYPEFSESKLNPDHIILKLFPGEQADEQKLRYVMTDLSRLLEDFLSYIEFEKGNIYRNHLLLNSFDMRGLDKYFISVLEESLSAQVQQPIRDVNFYFNRYLIEENAYEHSLARKPRAISSSLQEAVDNLDYYYLSNRLRYSCAILNRETLMQESYNNVLLGQIFEFLSKINLDHVPSISIYRQIALTYLESDHESHFQKLKKLLGSHIQQFPEEEIKDMYIHALNYCLRKINSGQVNMLSELVSLYKTLIENEIIFENGFIQPMDVKNIVTAALRAGEIAWAENFLHDYKNRFEPEYREATYTYNLANLYYYKKEFSKALRQMQTADIDDIYYHLDAKVLLLKTYFELDETEPFFSLVDAFTNYLKRNKLIAENQRSIYLNFVKYAKKLMQIRQGSKISIDDLRNDMNHLKAVANLQWLNEKLDEIVSSKK